MSSSRVNYSWNCQCVRIIYSWNCQFHSKSFLKLPVNQNKLFLKTASESEWTIPEPASMESNLLAPSFCMQGGRFPGSVHQCPRGRHSFCTQLDPAGVTADERDQHELPQRLWGHRWVMFPVRVMVMVRGSHQLGLRIMACNTCIRIWVFFCCCILSLVWLC